MKVFDRCMIVYGLFCASVLVAHHGPGWRGFNPNQAVAIMGVITKCFDCNNGGRGHGYLTVKVGDTSWEVTLPDTPRLRKAKEPVEAEGRYAHPGFRIPENLTFAKGIRD